MDGVVQEGDFDLVLEIFERERSYGVHLKYNPDLYKQAVIERLFGHYCTLLTGISENPDCPLHEYTILPDHERQRLLVEYNDTRVEYAFWRGPHELIEEQVDLAPDAPAITIGAERISYAQLNLRANQLAYLLRERGVGSEDLVGVCLDRSFELVISCLAILKSGGTYLPLDPKFPEERLRFMLADSEVSLVLAQSSTWRSLPKTSARVLLLDHESESLRKAPTTNLAFRNNPEHLAYLIYTSGSTGRPKGVMIPRRALVNCLLSMSRKPGIAHSSRHLAITTSSFDISILELLLPLVCGAEVVMATTEQASDGRELQRLLWQHEITVMQATPATWRMMLESGWEGKRDLRVFCGGEALTTDLAHKLQQRCRELWNMYGPTETTIWSSIRHLTSEEQISIGRPIDNTQIYVLDKRNKLQPVGVAGELHIAGEGLARGYLKREEMTREKFVGNPFEAGKRMYKTGDVGRWLEDGNLQYLGRMDTQVKIRGFRVETGEIEAQLNQHPKIRESAVIAQGEGGEKRLIGFYRAKEGGGDVVVELSYEELRGYLLKTLPEYMVPAGFVRVEAIPLSVNGKVDRRALGRMEVRIGVGREYVAPRNEIEEKLVGIWGEVLKGGVEKIGVNDNFFELGGHSLLATQLISKIRSRLGVEVPLKAVFERSRVGEMAELIGKVEKSEVPRIGVVDRGQMEGLPLSYAQERLWFINQLEPENVGYNIPGAVFIGGELDVEQLEEAFNVVIGRHENLRTVFPSQEGQARQVILERVEFKLERVELSGGEGAGWRERRAKEICQEEAGRAFDLERGPLMRGKVIELGEREHVLMLNMHHIITDGWSINVLIKELSLTLEAFGQGKRAELERLPIQYVDYSVWQRKWLQGETLDRQLDYWKKQLADIQPLELPMKPKRPEVPGSEAGKISWELSDELSRELKQLSMRQGTTLFMTLLASWQILLARYSGQKDVAVGTPIAGRRFAETHGLIGFFVNTLVLRMDLGGEPSFIELLDRVRKTTLEAFAHQDVPFEKLVEELQPERDLTRQPFFQVVFALEHVERGDVRLPGLQVTELELEGSAHRAKFDLMLAVAESGGRIEASFEYALDRFDPAMVGTMVGHWGRVLEQVVKQPSQPIESISLLAEGEQRGEATPWRGSRVHCEDELSMGRAVARNAERNPEALALASLEGELNYGSLNRQANQWAHYLRRQGAISGTRIGICLDSAVDWVTVSLGVLKSGCVLVGLEPNEPAERTKEILESGSVPLMVTSKQLASRIWEEATHVLLMEEQSREVAEESEQELDLPADGEAAACLMYRSSAMGRPLGIVIPHRALCGWEAAKGLTELGLKKIERVAQACTFSRESGSVEIFRTLARGACLVSLPIHPPLPPRKLAALLRDQRVAVLWTSASALEPLGREFPWCLKNIEQIFCEDRIEDLIQLRKKLKPEVVERVRGVYGYSEAGGSLITYPLVAASETVVDLERLTPGTQMYVLNEWMKPAAVGELGEVFVGGDFVALGYEAREGKLDILMPDPFGEKPGARMFRTGEKVRLHPQGSLEYRGRRDRQVIKGGFRLQLEEIESSLLDHPAIRQAAVLPVGVLGEAKDDFSALVVTKEEAISEEELRSFLLRKLPRQMVPRNIVLVDKINRTKQGKVSFDQAVQVAPRTPVEQELAQIWSELLEVQTVSIYDNFFELGGHSLLATQLIAKVNNRFKQLLPLAIIFTAPTIAALARVIASKESIFVDILVPIQTNGIAPPIFGIPGAGGNVLSLQSLSRALGSRQPFYGLQAVGLDGKKQPLNSVEQTAQVNIAALKTIQPTGPYNLIGHSYGGVVAYEMARMLLEQGERISSIILLDAMAPWVVQAKTATDEATDLFEVCTTVANLYGVDLKVDLKRLRKSSTEENIQYVVNLLNECGVEIDDELFAVFYKVFRANLSCYRIYKPLKLLCNVEVSLYRATQRHEKDTSLPEDYGWGRLLQGPIHVYNVNADHFSILERVSIKQSVADVTNANNSEYEVRLADEHFVDGILRGEQSAS